MRWVDRGTEPAGVEEYRLKYTQGWVDHFSARMGQKSPNLINHWRDFRAELGSRFNHKCGYCERASDANSMGVDLSPTLDHFRPLNRFPELAYVWANWVFSCKRCNEAKEGYWPESGYVDPCADDISERPEEHFDVDGKTGEILAKNLPGHPDNAKAKNTIADIGLNALDIRYLRFDWINNFKTDLEMFPKSERQALVEFYTAPDTEYSGVIGMLVNQLRQSGEI